MPESDLQAVAVLATVQSASSGKIAGRARSPIGILPPYRALDAVEELRPPGERSVDRATHARLNGFSGGVQGMATEASALLDLSAELAREFLGGKRHGFYAGIRSPLHAGVKSHPR